MPAAYPHLRGENATIAFSQAGPIGSAARRRLTVIIPSFRQIVKGTADRGKNYSILLRRTTLTTTTLMGCNPSIKKHCQKASFSALRALKLGSDGDSNTGIR